MQLVIDEFFFKKFLKFGTHTFIEFFFNNKNLFLARDETSLDPVFLRFPDSYNLSNGSQAHVEATIAGSALKGMILNF